MGDLWLPGYEHRPVRGAGLSVGPGAPKVGSHTTETGPGSFDALERHWRANWGSGLPHFLQEGGRIAQFLPLNVGGYTAMNLPGGADINRSGPLIQIETISRAADGWDDETYEAFGRWLADLKTAGHDFDIGQHPRFYGPNEGIVLATRSSPIRLSAAEFDAFNGWLGHQHLPENDHWDPGGIDGDRIERIARAHLTTEKDWLTMASEADVRKVVREEIAAALGDDKVTQPIRNHVYAALDQRRNDVNGHTTTETERTRDEFVQLLVDKGLIKAGD